MSPTISFLSIPFDLRVIAIIHSLLSQFQFVQSSICYDSSGVENNKLYSCQPDAPQSACCAPGDICYSSGLCAPGPIYQNQSHLTPFFWNGCSDASFAITGCFSSCFHVEGNGVQPCPQAGADHYCCYGFHGCNCSDSKQVFSIPPATILTTIDPAVTVSTSTSSAISTPRGSASTTLSSTVPNTGTSSPTNTASSSDSSSHAVAIGVGVGVGIPAAIAIAALIFFVMRHRKRKALGGMKSRPTELMVPENDKYDQRGIVAGHRYEVEGNYEVPELHASPIR